MASDLVLLVDDEPSIRQLARIYLEREGYSTLEVGDGLSALDIIKSKLPVLVILDIMLPEMDGFDVCRKLRAEGNSIPIIMLTARDEDFDKILGLELGADDYLTKPFNPRALTARVKAILRRRTPPLAINPTVISRGDLHMDLERRELFVGQQNVSLRMQEFEVLRVLLESAGKAFSREQLLSLAWGYDFAGQTRTVDVHIAQIRRKLAASATRIETIPGFGYKLVI